MKLHADSRFGLLVSPTDPTDLLDPSDQSGQSEKKTEIGDRISKFLNVTICTPPDSKKKFVLLSPRIFFFWKDFSEK